MNKDKLREILSGYENERVEFKLIYALKKSPKMKDEFAKDIIALANAAGRKDDDTAYLIVGAGDKLDPGGARQRLNVSESDYNISDLRKLVNMRCTHSISLTFEPVELDGSRYGIFTIPLSPYVHHLIKDLDTPTGLWRKHSVLTRIGDQVQVADPREIQRMQKEKEQWSHITPTPPVKSEGPILTLLRIVPLIALVFTPLYTGAVNMLIQTLNARNEDTGEFIDGFVPVLVFVVSLLVAWLAWIAVAKLPMKWVWRIPSMVMPVIALVLLISNRDHVWRCWSGAWSQGRLMPVSLELVANPDRLTFGSGKQSKLSLSVNKHDPPSTYRVIVKQDIDKSSYRPYFDGSASSILSFDADSWLLGRANPGGSVIVPLTAIVFDQNGKQIGETRPARIVVVFKDKVEIVRKGSRYPEEERRMYFNDSISLLATVNGNTPPTGCRFNWNRNPEIGAVALDGAELDFKAPQTGEDGQKMMLMLTVLNAEGKVLGTGTMTLVMVLPRPDYTVFVVDSSARMGNMTEGRSALETIKRDLSKSFDRIRGLGGMLE